MNLYVDESGSFAIPASQAPTDSWSVVVCYVSPESDQGALADLMSRVRTECGNGGEVKINSLTEAQYVRWLRDLSRLSGLAFAVAVDVSLHDVATLAVHRDGQAQALVQHLEKVVYESARRGLSALADDIRHLPLQLYTQLQCQIELFHQVLVLAPLYYAQFKPQTLSGFAWRIDRKDIGITRYEDAFRRVLTGALQTKFLREPMIMLEEADYSYMAHFEYAPGTAPTHLRDTYGIETSGDGLNASMLMNEDFEYVDSAAHAGVQAADLLASGLRRLLKGRFERRHEIALCLGGNLVRQLRGRPPVRLMSLGHGNQASPATASLMALLARKAKPILHG